MNGMFLTLASQMFSGNSVTDFYWIIIEFAGVLWSVLFYVSHHFLYTLYFNWFTSPVDNYDDVAML